MGAWIRGWRESNFDVGREGHVGPENFGGLKKMEGANIFVVGEILLTFVMIL